MENDETDSIISTSCSSLSLESDEELFLTEEEIEKLYTLFKKELHKTYGLLITPKLKKTKKSENSIQSITNEKCSINEQINNNLNVNIQKQENFQKPIDIPPIANTFIGRNLELNKVEKILREKNLVIITGIEGIGKTEFAKYYIEKYYKKYEGNVEWINGITKEKFQESISYLIKKYDLEDTAENFIKYFKRKRVLFVIDNACNKLNFRNYFPRSSSVSLIITTEYAEINQKRSTVYLTPLKSEESLDLFQNILEDDFTRSEDYDWVNLTKYFQNIPLSLQFIGVCLREEMKKNKNLTVDSYMNTLKKKYQLILDNPLSKDYKKVYFSFKLTIEQLNNTENQKNLALDILNTCIYFDDNIINSQLLLEHKSIGKSKEKLNEVLDILKKYKLITVVVKQNSNEIHIHNLIRRMLFESQKEENTIDKYVKMALALSITLSLLNIKHFLKMAENFMEIFVSYIIDNKLLDVFYLIIKSGYHNILDYILQISSDPEDLINRLNFLEIAINEEQIEVIKVLIEFDADVNKMFDNKETPLQLATKKFNPIIVELLLESGANVFVSNKDGRTALHIAAGSESWTGEEEKAIQCSRLLLKKGADINARDNVGLTPLGWALKNKAYKLITFLLLYLKKIFYTENETEILLEILDWDINEDKEEKLALDVIKILVNMKTDVTTKDYEGRNLLHWAVQNRCLRIVEFLLDECEMDVNDQDNYGQTALHIILNQIIATKSEAKTAVAIIKMLIEHEADTEIEDAKGDLPSDVAKERGNVKLNLLVKFFTEEPKKKKKPMYYLEKKSHLKSKKKDTSTTYWNTNPYRNTSHSPRMRTHENHILPAQQPVHWIPQSNVPGPSSAPSYPLLN